MGVAGSVLAFGMSKLFGTKGLSGAGKSAFGSTLLLFTVPVAALALYGMSGFKEPTNRCRSIEHGYGDVSAVAVASN